MVALILGFTLSILTVLYHWYTSTGTIIVIALIGAAIVNAIEQLANINTAPNRMKTTTLLAFIGSFGIGMIFDLWFVVAHNWGQPIGIIATLSTIGTFILHSLNYLRDSLTKQNNVL